MVGHGCHAGVRPNIFCRLDHVYDGIQGQDEPEDGDRSVHAACQRERQEEASHGDSGIADGRDNRKKKPKEHRGNGQLHASVLHDK